MRLAGIEELESLLLRMPGLVKLQIERSEGFQKEAALWLKAAEDALAANRRAETATLAAIRSALASVEQGESPNDLIIRGQATRSRVAGLATARALRQGAETLTAVVSAERQRTAEAERWALQVIAAARSRGLLRARNEGEELTGYLRALRKDLASSEDLEGAIVRMEGLVGPSDTLVLLDRADPPPAASPEPNR